MNGVVPSEGDLAEAIGAAAGLALRKLFREHPERFYYVALITTGEALPPSVAAWSVEALAVAEGKLEASERGFLKWSYAESPYLGFGEEFFEEVSRLFSLRPAMTIGLSSAEWIAEHKLRLRAMERAMKRLDDEGLFGRGARRAGIVVLVEVMPPDRTNTERAVRLNPPEAIREWLAEASEP